MRWGRGKRKEKGGKRENGGQEKVRRYVRGVLYR